MSVRTDVINLNVNVNGDSAKNQLNELKKRAADIKVELQNMKKGTAEYISKSAELKQVESEMTTLKQQIGITSLSLKELTAEKNKLYALVRSANPLSAEFQEYSAQLKVATEREKDLKAGIAGFHSFAEQEAAKAGSAFERVFARVTEYITAAFAIEKVIDFFKEAISESNQYEESIVNLQNALENAGRVDLFGTFNEDIEKFASIYQRIKPEEFADVFTKLIDYGKLTKTQITDLTDVIVNYAAKENVSITEATDVFTKALEGNSKGLKTFGIDIGQGSTVTERFGIIMQQLKPKIEGAEQALEQTTKGGWEIFKTKVSEVAKSIGDFITGNDKLEQQQHQLAVSAHEEAEGAQALVDKYEALSKKTNQTAADKKQLQAITASLAGTFGTSVVAINKETGALELNVDATRDLIKQKLLLANNDAAKVASQYEAAVEGQKKATDDLSVSQQVYNTQLKNYGLSIDDIQKKLEHESLDALSKHEQEVYKTYLGYRNASISLTDYNKQIGNFSGQLKDLGFSASDVDKLFNPKIDNAVIGAGSIEATKNSLNALKKDLSDLQDAYGNIDISNTAALTKNMNQQKILEKEIADLEGKTQAAAVKKSETTYEQLKKQADEFVDKVTKMRSDLLIAGGHADDTEVANVSKKYSSLFEEVKTTYTKFQQQLNNIDTTAASQKSTLTTQFETETKNVDKQSEQYVNAYAKFHQDLRNIDATTASQKSILTAKFETEIKDFGSISEEYKNAYSKFQQDLKNIDTTATSQKSTLTTQFETETKNVDKQSEQYVNAYAKFHQDLKNIDTTTASQKSTLTAKFETEIKDFTSISEEYKNAYTKFQQDLQTIDVTATSQKSTLTAQFEIETKNFDKQSVQYVNAYAKFQQDLKNIDNSTAEQKSTRTSKFNLDTKDFYKQSEEYQNAYTKLQQNLKIIDDKELVDIQVKYTNLISDAKKAYGEIAGNHLLNAKQGFALEKEYSESMVDLKQQESTEIEALYKKRFAAEVNKEYSQTLDNQKKYDDKLREQAAQEYIDEKITKEQYSQQLIDIDQHEKDQMLLHAKEYAASVAQAAIDQTKLEKEQSEERIKNAVAERDQKNKIFQDNAITEAQQQVLSTKPGSKENIQAQKDVITTQFLFDTQGWNTTSKKYKDAEAKLQKDLNDADENGAKQRAENLKKWANTVAENIEKWGGVVQNALSTTDQIIDGIENRQLEKEKARNTAKSNAYKKQMDSKLISQGVYDKKTQEISDEQDKQQAKIQKRQADRQKILSVFNIAAQTAEAVMKAVAASPLTFGAPWAEIDAGLGALSIAAVLAQPSLGTGAWVREGDKHSAPSGGINAKIERDEAVMSAKAMTDKTNYTVTGTVAQITSKLNSINGGAAWAAGAGVEPKWRAAPVAHINPDMPHILAAGIYNATRSAVNASSSSSGDMSDTNNLLQQLINEQKNNTEEIKNMKKNLKAHVVFKEIKSTEAQYNAAQQASSIKQ